MIEAVSGCVDQMKARSGETRSRSEHWNGLGNCDGDSHGQLRLAA